MIWKGGTMVFYREFVREAKAQGLADADIQMAYKTVCRLARCRDGDASRYHCRCVANCSGLCVAKECHGELWQRPMPRVQNTEIIAKYYHCMMAWDEILWDAMEVSGT